VPDLRIVVADDHPVYRSGLRAALGDDGASVVAAIAAGARGYLVKGAGQEEIVRAIRAVASGDLLLGGAVAGYLVEALAAGARKGWESPFPDLTARELEILDLMARGHANGVIARHLVLADKTVRNHVSNVLAKLGCANRAAAVALARDAGLGAG
jgi:DNA-binding NarL/FixJ family response regulator